jgi:hypothetical protein
VFKDLYNQNYKILNKEMIEDNQNLERSQMFTDKQICENDYTTKSGL